jgi:hypothetical protein
MIKHHDYTGKSMRAEVDKMESDIKWNYVIFGVIIAVIIFCIGVCA